MELLWHNAGMIRRLFAPIICCIFLLSISNDLQASPRQGLKSSLRIINGLPMSVKGTSVVKILLHDGSGEFLCTGTLIAPDAVLTASHCVTRVPSQHTVYVSGRAKKVSKVRIHPNARSDSTNGAIIADVAVLILQTKVSTPYLPLLVSREMRSGDQIAIMGFGLDELNRMGRLRQGAMNISSTDSQFIYATYNGQLSNTCEGDSGGPAIYTYYDSQGQLVSGIVGVTSGGEKEDCSAGDLSFFTNMQTSSMANWVKKRSAQIRLD